VSAGERPVSAFAPASVGNVGVGFDLLGHAIEGIGDWVTARRVEAPGVIIESIRGTATKLPADPMKNTAGRAALAVLEAADADFGVCLDIHKGIPLSSGLGGSAASASAAVTAVNRLLPEPLPLEMLYQYALIGEAVSSGDRHGDNVGPQLYGGLVLATPVRVVPVPVPPDLHTAVVHPDYHVETRVARQVLGQPIGIADHVRQQARFALVLAGCFQADYELIAEGLEDVLIEPRRAALIPGFAAVRQAALDAGALGASISGAGPSLFAWCRGRPAAEVCARAMREAFARSGLDAQAHISPVAARGAHIVNPEATASGRQEAG